MSQRTEHKLHLSPPVLKALAALKTDLKLWMKKKDLSQTDVERMAGTGRGTVWNICSGNCHPSFAVEHTLRHLMTQ